MSNYNHVNFNWDDDTAASLDPVGRLIYRSNLLGSDQRITSTLGGNTSAKILEIDPLTDQEVEVLWVKGSGGDLRTSTRESFASLYQDKLLKLQHVYAAKADKGLKSDAEDAMLGLISHATFNLNLRTPSIDTTLHSFIPGKHVDHMHSTAIIAIAATPFREKLTREIFGGQMAYLPWMRAGIELGLAVQEIVRKQPDVKAIMVGQHGFISWDDDDKVCYTRTLDFIEKAATYIEEKYQAKGGDATAFGGQKFTPLETGKRNATLASLIPWLRGQLSNETRVVATVQDDEKMLRFVNSTKAPGLAELGSSCPDHVLRTKIKPLYVDWNPQSEDVEALKSKLAAGLEAYRNDYLSYYTNCKRDNSPAMRDPNPTVVLIPGLGMIAWGRDKAESRVTAELYSSAVEVMRGAEAIVIYIALSVQEAFDLEYWPFQAAKLKRKAAEKELAGQIILVVGAGSGIGKETAHRLAKEGAHIVCVDLNAAAAELTAHEITEQLGQGIGVAGTGISACGPAIGLAANITNRASIRTMLDQVALAYGGFDSICVTARIFVPSDTTGHIPDHKWAQTFNINAAGSYLLADEAFKTWKAQGLRGNLVLTTSANAAMAKKGSLAHDTSKAAANAANHLVRELAMELSPLVRVNCVAHATVVQGSAMFPRDRVIGSLAKYGIPFNADEATDSLVTKLAQFYADRTLTKSPITPADQAEAYFLLVTKRLSKTTGQVITVDGGLHEAFLH